MNDQPMSNLPIISRELPAFPELPMEAISPNYRQLNLALSAAITFIICGVVLTILWQPWIELPDNATLFFSVATGVVCLLGCWAFCYHFYADKLIFYTLREQDIVLFKGLIFKKVICQPILRIQHIDVQRGPFERMCNLATLKVYSAGGSEHTLAIPGLNPDIAEKIRSFVLNHSDLSRDE